MTYDELETAAISWLNREGFTQLEAEMPTFFLLAQNRIALDPDIELFGDVVTATITTDVPTIPLDFERPLSYSIVSGDDKFPLKGAAMPVIESISGTGRPQFISPTGLVFRFGPEPDTAYDVEVTYYTTLPQVSATVAENSLSTAHPEAILFAVLLEACLWLKDDQRAQVWEGRYRQVKTDIRNEQDWQRFSPGSLKMQTAYNTGFENVRAN